MTNLPDAKKLYAATEATWPAARIWEDGSWTFRDGQGGGKRVSAATAHGPVDASMLSELELKMQQMEQTPLIMLREGDDALDAQLAANGYEIIDPVNMYACDLDLLTREVPPRVTAFDIWEPMAIQADIWAAGGIGPARIEVMHRVEGPKTALFGRENARPAATGFAAIADGIAMIHALEVLKAHQRKGLGKHLTRHAGHWAAGHGATHLAVLCTKANEGANALYSSLGMTLVGHYHYRIKKDA